MGVITVNIGMHSRVITFLRLTKRFLNRKRSSGRRRWRIQCEITFESRNTRKVLEFLPVAVGQDGDAGSIVLTGIGVARVARRVRELRGVRSDLKIEDLLLTKS